MFPNEIVMPRYRDRALHSGKLLGSPAFVLFFFVLALYFTVSRQYVIGTLVFAALITLEFFLVSDLSVIAVPFLFLTVFVSNCYDSYDTFIRFIWFAPLPIAAILYNCIRFRAPVRTGRTLIGLIAVSAALLLGGLGTVAPEDYFSGTSLFYMLGLGVALVGVYLILRSRFATMNVYGLFGRVSFLMYMVGMLALANVLASFLPAIMNGTITDLTTWEAYGAGFRASNNLSTFLMFAMPFPVWYALKQNPFHILSLLVFYGAIVLSGSRAGLLLGALELLFCLIVWVRYSGRGARFFTLVIVSSGILVGGILAGAMFADSDFSFIEKTEMRSQAIPVAIKSFLEHPVFGIGIKNHALDEFHQAKEGALAWFHMYIPQIIATMGSVGIVAYGLQLILRASLIFRRRNSPLRLTLGMSYIGVFLMSQLNPGEFCPVPYGMMIVAIFALLEQLDDTEAEARLLAPEWS